MSNARWSEKAFHHPIPCIALQKELGLHPLTARLLVLRGVRGPEDAEKFLSPSFSNLPDPISLKGMRAACQRIERALKENEHIVIYGDYDVDGVTSTSLFCLFLREIGVDPSRLHFFIPHRIEHGYGLQKSCLPLVKEPGCDLLITVDCGITSREEVAMAQEMGIDTIILDHHLAPAELPEAHAILNPHQPGCEYPFKHLAAVGVTFNLLVGLRRHLREKGFFAQRREPNLRKFLDLVALGTVADIVPLQGVNRIFVQAGLEQMRQTEWVGLDALMRVAGVKRARLSAGSVGFQIGPRINAAGRMREASTGVRLLTTRDVDEAATLSEQLNRENQSRRELERSIHREARQMLLQSEQMMEAPAVVLAHEGWHPGVIGIVASRIVEEFHRPTVIIAMQQGAGKGSARSIPGFHMHQGLSACSDHLIQFGGHKAAAGLSIEAEHLAAFRDALVAFAAQTLTPEELTPKVEYDAVFAPDELSEALLEELVELEPHGMSNPAPLLLGVDVPVIRQRCVGNEGKHVQFQVPLPGQGSIKAIAFSKHDYYPLDKQATFAYRPQFDYWQGRRSIQIQVKHIQGQPHERS